MLGKRSDQRGLFEADQLSLELVGQHSICVQCQAIEGSDCHSSGGNQSAPRRATAFRYRRSLRMTATRAILPVWPRCRRPRWQCWRMPACRITDSAAMLQRVPSSPVRPRHPTASCGRRWNIGLPVWCSWVAASAPCGPPENCLWAPYDCHRGQFDPHPGRGTWPHRRGKAIIPGFRTIPDPCNPILDL